MVRAWVFGLVAGVGLAAGCGGSASDSASKPASQNDLTEQSPASQATMYARAQEAEQQGKPLEAVELYRQILDTYPDSPQNYKAIFLIGFVYSEKLEQPDSARQMFEQVIREYPDCEFEDDAQAMLRFLDGHLPEFEETPNS